MFAVWIFIAMMKARKYTKPEIWRYIDFLAVVLQGSVNLTNEQPCICYVSVSDAFVLNHLFSRFQLNGHPVYTTLLHTKHPKAMCTTCNIDMHFVPADLYWGLCSLAENPLHVLCTYVCAERNAQHAWCTMGWRPVFLPLGIVARLRSISTWLKKYCRIQHLFMFCHAAATHRSLC